MFDMQTLMLISIHAPREGCDLQCFGAYVVEVGISIHAPREGCDILQRVLQKT